MEQLWIRKLIVKLTSQKVKKSYTFGTFDNENLSMHISGYKYMSTLKDSCTIEIKNLSYAQVIDIINSEYYDVEVKCGYKYGSITTIFKGYVIYISNNLETDKTHTISILCGSNLIAKYKQKRLNISLNSSINIYTALKFLTKAADVTKTNIDLSMIQTLSNDITNVNTTFANFVDNLTTNRPNFAVSTDSTFGSDFSIYDFLKTKKRVIKLQKDWIALTGGYPRLTSEGLRMTVLPTTNFVCSDIIQVDNALINVYASSESEANKMYANYLDKEGQYLIYQIKYDLENYGSSFSIELLCKSLTNMRKMLGKENEV